MLKFGVLRDRVQRFLAAVCWLVLAIPLIVAATPQARAFDAEIRNYASPVPLAGFSSTSLSDNCVIQVENLRVGASPAGTGSTTGTSFIDFRRVGGVGGLPTAVAATPQELDEDSLFNSFYPAITAEWIEGKCDITNVTNLVQTSPNAPTYADASYHGVSWRGRQGGVLYEWEVAFTGRTSTQFINTRTLVSEAVLGLNATVSATTQTVGRPFTFTVTPSATVAATSGQLTLTATFPDFYGVNASGTDWSCSNSTPAFATTVTCTSSTSIAAGSNGSPVTFTVTSASATAGYAQSFSLSGGGASAAAVATAPSVTINGIPATQVQVASTILVQGTPATPFTPVRVTNGGTAPFTWAVSPDLPDGLTFDQNSGEVGRTPTVASATRIYTFTPTDARGAVPTGALSTRQATITVRLPPPEVTSISPNHGALGGGTGVTINGSNFSGATAVRFGSVTRTTGFTINPAGDRITIASPPGGGLGPVQVAVVTPSGESADTPQDDFTYVVAPTISTAWSVASIPADGTTMATLSITVTNPNAANTLTISGPLAGSFPVGMNYATASSSVTETGGAVLGTTVINHVNRTYSFVIQALPPGSTATLRLGFTSDTVGSYSFTSGTIASSGGTGAAGTTPTPLTVVEATPTISNLVTRVGPLAGGTSVVINGNRFLSATDVTFDGVPAQSFIRHSQTQITAVSPARATAGTVRVAVTNAAGTTPDTSADDFSYVAAPTLTAAFSPTTIPPNGVTTANLTLTITNPNNVGLTGFAIAAGTLPSGLSGVALSSTCGSGTATLSSGALSLSGATVPASGSCVLTLIVTSTTPGSYAFTSGQMTGPFGTAAGATTATNLTVLPLPAVTSITPNLGNLAGGTPVTITGTDFTGATEVRFGGRAVFAAGLNVNGTGTEITLNTPSQVADGPVQVQVITPGGISTDAVNFTYAAPPSTSAQWTLTSIAADDIAQSFLTVTVRNPNSSASSTLTALNASGTIPAGLRVDAAGAAVGSGAATGVNLTITGNSYSLDIGTLPAGDVVTLGIPVSSAIAGSYAVTTNATTSSVGNGLAATTPTPLTVVARPFITSISPTQGPLAGGTPITINGSNFSGATEVRFDGRSVLAAQFISNTGTVLRVPSPVGLTAGPVRVSVVTPGGESADVALDEFTYVLPPTATAAFSVASIPGNGTATADVVLTIANPNSVALAGVGNFSAPLPAGLVGSGAATTCSGGSAEFSLAGFRFFGATLPANGSCTVSFKVSSTSAGSYSYTFGDVTGTFIQVTGPQTSANLTVLPMPVITSISPTEGPLAGVPVTINGSGFTGATEVKFGANSTTSGITVNGAGTQITVQAPAGSAGVAQVSVVTPAGESGTTPFTYVAAPTIASFTFGTTVPYNTGAAGSTPIDVVTGGAVKGAPTSYTLVNPTPGGGVVTMVGATGIVDYTPAVGFRGPFTFEVNATNVGGTSSNATVTINVGDPALTASVPVATGTVGEAYSQQVAMSGGTGPYSAFAATGLPDGLTISSSGLISGTPTGAGTFASVVVTATDSSTGAGPFTGAAAAFSLSIAQGSQAITFTSTAPTAAVVGGTYAVSATGGASGEPVTFAIDGLSSGVCTVSGGTVSFIGVGTCIVFAKQAGNANYTPATEAAQKFEVGQGSQAITFTSLAPTAAMVGGATYAVTVTGGASGNPVNLSIDAGSAGVCQISGSGSGSTVIFIGVGTCDIRATQAGNANFGAAPDAVQSFAVGQGAQVITFTSSAPTAATVGGATYTVTATGGASGNPVNLSIDAGSAGVCQISGSGSGSTVSFIGVGTCDIRATQAGNANFAAAPDAVQSFAVGQASQTITFPDPAQTEFAPGDTVTLTATASPSGLTVVFSSLTPEACTATADGLVTFIKAGACTVAADQPGDATYLPAAQVTKTLNVTGVDQATEVELIAKAQQARARALVLNQPDLTPLLDASPDDSTALSVSSKGADINLIRMGGPVWLRLSGSISEQANGARDHYVQLSLGTHVSTGPQSILGLMATVDSIRLTDPTGQVDGRGWLIGPYFVTRLGTTDLAFEVRALTGRTVDRVAQIGAPPSTVDGKRSLLMAKLSGTFKLDETLTISPSMSIAGVDQASAAYVAFGGTPIPGVTTSYRQAAFGLNLQHESVNDYGALTTRGGLGLFLSDTSGSGTGQGLNYSFGFTQKIGEESSLDVDLTGQRDVKNDSDTVGLSVKFESRF